MTRLSRSILTIPIVFVLLFSFSGCDYVSDDPLVEHGGDILSPLRLISDGSRDYALYVDDSTGVIYAFVTRGGGDKRIAGLTAILKADGTPKLYEEYIKENEVNIGEQGDTSNE